MRRDTRSGARICNDITVFSLQPVDSPERVFEALAVRLLLMTVVVAAANVVAPADAVDHFHDECDCRPRSGTTATKFFGDADDAGGDDCGDYDGYFDAVDVEDYLRYLCDDDGAAAKQKKSHPAQFPRVSLFHYQRLVSFATIKRHRHPLLSRLSSLDGSDAWPSSFPRQICLLHGHRRWDDHHHYYYYPYVSNNYVPRDRRGRQRRRHPTPSGRVDSKFPTTTSQTRRLPRARESALVFESAAAERESCAISFSTTM